MSSYSVLPQTELEFFSEDEPDNLVQDQTFVSISLLGTPNNTIDFYLKD